MKLQIGRLLLGLAMLFMLAGIYAPLQAAAETHIVVSVGYVHHRHYYRHRVYYHHYYRHYRRDDRDYRR